MQKAIDLGEIEDATDELPSSKAPDPDRISSEIYRCFKSGNGDEVHSSE